jgi:predicted enzyme related to lactoylglutathione lyase
MKLGYTLLYVEDVEQTMNFYSNAFGLEKGFAHDSGQYGEMNTGSTKLGFVKHELASSHGFEYEKASLRHKCPGFEIGLIASDVSAAYQQALRAGAVAVSAPASKPWGQIVSYVRDCNGFLVEICSAME